MTMKKTDKQLIFSKLFPDEESCIRYYEDKRWGGNPVSPFELLPITDSSDIILSPSI